MTVPIRLRAVVLPDGSTVRFHLEFAEAGDQLEVTCAPGLLKLGDGHEEPQGQVCAPTVFTWRDQRCLELCTHSYEGQGPFTAVLEWGEVSASATVQPGKAVEESVAPRPELPLFALQHLKQEPLQVAVNLQLRGLGEEQKLRVDGGAGQVLWIDGSDGADQTAEGTWNYSKPGTYQVGVDLVDTQGFWLATLAESPLEVVFPREEPVPSEQPDIEVVGASDGAPAEGIHAASSVQPWLPYRYARPMWSGVWAYTVPGSGVVSRALGWGTYISVHAETVVGGAVWYKTGGGDWVSASSVDVMLPSALRGVELGSPLPEPPPPPPPEPPEPPPPPSPEEVIARGVVTAVVLNVRARPGVSGDNPVIDRLRSGQEVDIYEEQSVAGELWYRIGVDRWVHGGYVELYGEPAPTPEPPTPPVPPYPGAPIGQGVVTAARLNVRAEPGVRPDNPPIDQLGSGARVEIFEESVYEGDTWYRIGEGRWIHSGWVVRVDEPEPAPTPPAPGPSEPIGQGIVTASLLNVRARPGVSADNPPIDHLWSGAEVVIHGQDTSDGELWYRIGEDRWIHSGWVRILEPLAERVVSDAESVVALEPESAPLTAVVAVPDTAPAPEAPATLISSAEDAVELPLGWVIPQSLNVRSTPSTVVENEPVDTVYHNQLLQVLEIRWAEGAEWYRIGQDRWVHGSYVALANGKTRPSSIGPDERWVAVCLSQQTLVAYEGDRPVYAAMAATGNPGTPTVQGIFRTWRRLTTGVMAGPGYYIEDVTWTCYFYSGYALHTAYWHDGFGATRSHGCVNLSPHDAWWVYEWSEAGGPNSPAVYVYWA